jgi:hypothetical protein
MYAEAPTRRSNKCSCVKLAYELADRRTHQRVRTEAHPTVLSKPERVPLHQGRSTKHSAVVLPNDTCLVMLPPTPLLTFVSGPHGKVSRTAFLCSPDPDTNRQRRTHKRPRACSQFHENRLFCHQTKVGGKKPVGPNRAHLRNWGVSPFPLQALRTGPEDQGIAQKE